MKKLTTAFLYEQPLLSDEIRLLIQEAYLAKAIDCNLQKMTERGLPNEGSPLSVIIYTLPQLQQPCKKLDCLILGKANLVEKFGCTLSTFLGTLPELACVLTRERNDILL